jgi:hypothetical protein
MTEPPVSNPLDSNVLPGGYIDTVFTSNKPAVSNIDFNNYVNEYVVYILAPLAESNTEASLIIAIAMDISPTSISHLINLDAAGKTGYVEIVDGSGVVLATSKPENFLKPSDHDGVFANLIRTHNTAVSTCHSCHTATEEQKRAKEIITFAPLSAPWVRVIRQPEAGIWPMLPN